MKEYRLEAQRLVKEGRLTKENAILALNILQHNQNLGKTYTLEQVLVAKKMLQPISTDVNTPEMGNPTRDSNVNQKQSDPIKNNQKKVEEVNDSHTLELEEATSFHKSDSQDAESDSFDPLELQELNPIGKNTANPSVASKKQNQMEELENDLELEDTSSIKNRNIDKEVDVLDDSVDYVDLDANQSEVKLSRLKRKLAIGVGVIAFALVFVGLFAVLFPRTMQLLTGEIKVVKVRVDEFDHDAYDSFDFKNHPKVISPEYASFDKDKIIENMVLVYSNETSQSEQIMLGYLINYMGEKYIVMDHHATKVLFEEKITRTGTPTLIFKFKFLKGDETLYDATVFSNIFHVILRPKDQKIKNAGFTLNPFGSYTEYGNLSLVGTTPSNPASKGKDITSESVVSIGVRPSKNTRTDTLRNVSIKLNNKMKIDLQNMICINPLFELVGMQNYNKDSSSSIEREIESTKSFTDSFQIRLPEKSMQFQFKSRTQEEESVGELRFNSPYYFPDSSKFRITVSKYFGNKEFFVTNHAKLENNVFISDLTLLKELGEKNRRNEGMLIYNLRVCLEVDQGSGFKKVIDGIKFEYEDNNETAEHFDLEFKPLDFPFRISWFEISENGEFLLISSEHENMVHVYSLINNKMVTSIKIPRPRAILSRGDFLFIASSVDVSNNFLYKVSEKAGWQILEKYKIDSITLGSMSAPKGGFFKDTFFLYSSDTNSDYFLVNHSSGEIKNMGKRFDDDLPFYSFNGKNLIIQPMTKYHSRSTIKYIDFQEYMASTVSPNGEFFGVQKLNYEEEVEFLQQFSEGDCWISSDGIYWGFPPERVSKQFDGCLIGDSKLPLCYNLVDGKCDIYSADQKPIKLGSKSYHFFGSSDVFSRSGRHYRVSAEAVTILDKTKIIVFIENRLFMCSFDRAKK